MRSHSASRARICNMRTAPVERPCRCHFFGRQSLEDAQQQHGLIVLRQLRDRRGETDGVLAARSGLARRRRGSLQAVREHAELFSTPARIWSIETSRAASRCWAAKRRASLKRLLARMRATRRATQARTCPEMPRNLGALPGASSAPRPTPRTYREDAGLIRLRDTSEDQ